MVKDAGQDYPQYAIMLNIQDKPCCVIGGGLVATRKVRQLLECGADVSLVSPSITDELADLAENEKIRYLARDYEAKDVKEAQLVFAATDNPAINDRIAEDCYALRVLVNIAHASERSDFTNPGVLRYGPVQINVSTGGASPTLTRHIVDKVNQIIDERIGALADTLLTARQAAQRHIRDAEQRQEWLRRFGDDCWAAWEHKEDFPDWSVWIQQQEI